MVSLFMFKLFKKTDSLEKAENKPVEQIEQAETEAGQAESEKVTLDQGVTIYTMPERFRFDHFKVKTAKNTGLFIVIGGVIFLIIIATLFYFFIYQWKPTPPEQAGQKTEIATTSQSARQQAAPPIEPLPETTSPALEILPTETQATSSLVATSTTELTTATSTTATSTQISEPTEFQPVADSDGDGLTDPEEELIGSSKDSQDSDGDGYSDLTEVLNLYNPIDNQKLASNTNFTIYQNNTFKYSLLFPKNWSQTINGGEDSVMFRSADNHFIQVIVQTNSKKQTIQDWYREQFNQPTIPNNNLVPALTWYGIKGSDGLIIYLTDLARKHIYTLTYNPAVNNNLSYFNIFSAMVKSFTIIE